MLCVGVRSWVHLGGAPSTRTCCRTKINNSRYAIISLDLKADLKNTIFNQKPIKFLCFFCNFFPIITDYKDIYA